RKLNKIKEKIKEDKKEIFAEIEKKTNESLYNNDLNILSKHYIESKLDIKLPEDKNTGYLKNVIYIPRQRSRHPIVKKAIQFIDDNIKKRTSQFDKQNKNREKEKVRIGAATTPSRDGAILTQYGIDLTAIARNNQAPPIMGRENEIEQMTRILVRREKNNPVLLGEAGVGKTAIVMGLAQRIAAQDVPEILQNRRIIELNVGVLVAGTTYRGDFEKRINQIIKDVKNDPGIILFIDELHTLIGAGSSRRSLDASNILKPALAQGAMRLIGATTTGEYARSVEQDPALERRFSCIWVNEIDRRQTLEVLKARKQKWKEHHGVIISDDVLKQAVLLTDTQIKDRHLPDKAIDLIDESCSLARTTFKKEPDSQNPKSQTLTNNHIQKVLDKWTGAALAGKTRLNTFEYIKKIKQQLKEYIIGHDKLLDDLALIIAYKKMGVNKICDSGIFYFWGQPDTGKSECAKAMANILWPKENGRFLFINLELYNDEYSIAGLKGTPGSNETGILSLQLKHNPHSVIYLHNFHLAHTGVITFFNNLFREGCFSDSSGRNVFTQNAIFILSMSVTQESGHIGFTGSKPETKMDITTYLKKYNIPDSITESIQKVFWFDPLNEHNLRTLMEKKLDSIRQQPFVADFEIEFDNAFINELVGKYKNNPMNHRSLDMLFNREVFPYIIDQLNE
ncbi:MAG: ATP-dependent Clp protease ATP-binding subunit, partial [Spirochaetes bacterium]|nr:ATP-dependent Clp protease ATP-binding subunit [Spirochaetota bacterium]